MAAAKVFAVLLFIGTTILGIVLYFVNDVSLADLLSLGGGALCLFWALVVLTVPWNLYFQARRLIQEIGISRERGIAVPEAREPEARRIARRLLWGALGAHVISAGLIAMITWISGGVVGYWFAAFYVVSTLFRPGQAYLAHLSQRLTSMLREVKYPREDVLALIDRVTALENANKSIVESINGLTTRTAADADSTTTRFQEGDRKVEALGRRFEDAISQLTDNQEVISGIKAFLRLLRTEQS
ncbi:hypothetical protein [Embleya sp. NBC_00896]|uniref:hypothetical protein n=1 Tax=Embleya sp. NBC_00896 TaxID=2975961 RepID=UPI00386AAAB9|nr:hypothetical protein OG928_27515 [Embleya sp. NBC_00896]